MITSVDDQTITRTNFWAFTSGMEALFSCSTLEEAKHRIEAHPSARGRIRYFEQTITHRRSTGNAVSNIFSEVLQH